MKPIPLPIVLVRHGQTQWNAENRFRGRADIPLDDFGIRQAEAAATRLSKYPATAVYASPLQRTMMTARPVAEKLGLTVQPLDGLIDIDYGRWQGLSTEEALEQDSTLYHTWIESPQNAVFPGGEGLQDVRNRSKGVIDMVLASHRNETVILVSHMVVCRVFICVILGLDNSHFWQIGQDINAINTIGLKENGLVLNSLNDTCHLKALS